MPSKMNNSSSSRGQELSYSGSNPSPTNFNKARSHPIHIGNKFQQALPGNKVIINMNAIDNYTEEDDPSPTESKQIHLK